MGRPDRRGGDLVKLEGQLRTYATVKAAGE
jgi:hypothetical protein